MKRILSICCILLINGAALGPNGFLFAQEGGSLQVGAARVNVTPPPDAGFPMSGYAGRTEGFTGIHDSLYYRVIVIEDGRTQAAIVVGESIGITHEWFQEMTDRLESETGLRRENILLAATHTHAAPTPIHRISDPDDGMVAYSRELSDRVVQAVNQAQSRLEPARMGVGRGAANINVNRTARVPDGGYWLGYNPDGPSDKTVHVVRFDRMNGEPIAILVNYAVHAVVGGQQNLLVSADVAGAISRYVEQHFEDRVIVPWTSGAAGDQNPIYRADGSLDDGRIPPLTTQGQIVGEEVVRVADNIERLTEGGEIKGAQKVISLPGKEPNDYSSSGNYTLTPADDLDVRLSLLMINNLALVGISGEVLTGIGTRLKKESPFRDTILITHCNGASGYLADDQAFETPGYEIMVTRAMPGAEAILLDELLKMMERP